MIRKKDYERPKPDQLKSNLFHFQPVYEHPCSLWTKVILIRRPAHVQWRRSVWETNSNPTPHASHCGRRNVGDTDMQALGQRETNKAHPCGQQSQGAGLGYQRDGTKVAAFGICGLNPRAGETNISPINNLTRGVTKCLSWFAYMHSLDWVSGCACRSPLAQKAVVLPWQHIKFPWDICTPSPDASSKRRTSASRRWLEIGMSPFKLMGHCHGGSRPVRAERIIRRIATKPTRHKKKTIYIYISIHIYKYKYMCIYVLMNSKLFWRTLV